MGSALDCEGGFDAGYEEREELDEFAFSQYGEDAGGSGLDTRLRVQF